MGVCHLARATDVLLFPVGLAAVAICARVWARVRWTEALRDAAEFIAGWASIVIAETAIYWWATGDPLLRLRVVQGDYGSPRSIVRGGLNVDPRTIPFSLFPPVEWWLHGGWWRLNPEQAYHGLLFCAARSDSPSCSSSPRFGATRSRVRLPAPPSPRSGWLAPPVSPVRNAEPHGVRADAPPLAAARRGTRAPSCASPRDSLSRPRRCTRGWSGAARQARPRCSRQSPSWRSTGPGRGPRTATITSSRTRTCGFARICRGIRPRSSPTPAICVSSTSG